MADRTAERHVRFNDDPEGGWIVTGAAELPVEAHATTREGAVDEARKALESIGGGVLYIHDTDGSVQQQQPVDRDVAPSHATAAAAAWSCKGSILPRRCFHSVEVVEFPSSRHRDHRDTFKEGAQL